MQQEQGNLIVVQSWNGNQNDMHLEQLVDLILAHSQHLEEDPDLTVVARAVNAALKGVVHQQ